VGLGVGVGVGVGVGDGVAVWVAVGEAVGDGSPAPEGEVGRKATSTTTATRTMARTVSQLADGDGTMWVDRVAMVSRSSVDGRPMPSAKGRNHRHDNRHRRNRRSDVP
jgi:hypothetical protein